MKGFGRKIEIAWHYTTATRLLSLIKTRALKPFCIGLDPRTQPVVWFTKAEFYEPMAYPSWADANGIRRTMASEKEIADRSNGLLRVGVAADDACMKPLRQWREQREPGAQHAMDAMLNAARGQGSDPDQDWLVSFKPVSQKRWLHLQIAFPEDVDEQGVQTWSEWDLRAPYTKELLKLDAEQRTSVGCDEGESCLCCEPNQAWTNSNPLVQNLEDMINK